MLGAEPMASATWGCYHSWARRRFCAGNPDAQIKGLDGLREVFTGLLEDFGMAPPSFEMPRLSVHGEFAYIDWNARTVDNDYHVGSYTFVRDGKEVFQTFVAHITPRG